MDVPSADTASRCSTESELFRDVDQPGIGSYLTPGSPVAFDGPLLVTIRV